jgi:CHAT domain-containing protein/tetratricopeptide (TPR) repeat protein
VLLRVATFLVIFCGIATVASAQPHLLYNKAVSLGTTDSLQAAQLYFEAGKLYDEAYKFDSAVAVLIKSQSIFRALDPSGSLGEALADHALGDVYKYVLYDFNAAEKNYERALSIQERLGSGDTRNLTRLYYNLATTNRSQLEYETAITYCARAIEGANKMQDNTFLERCYSILGNIYRDMRRYDSAGQYYQKGIAVNRSINKGKQNETLAGFYSGWGDAFYKQGNLNEAAAKFTDAITIYDRIGAGDKLLHLHTIRLLAEVQMKRSESSKAWSSLQKADILRKSLNTARGGPVSAVYKSFGDYYNQNKNYVEALRYYDKALSAACRNFESNYNTDGFFNYPAIDDIELKGFAYDALIAKAAVLSTAQPELASLNDWTIEVLNDNAMTCYLLSEQLMIASRSELDSEDARWNFVDANFQLYEGALELIGRRESSDTVLNLAFHFMEGSKSKTLADALLEVEVRKTISRSDTLLPALRKLKQHSMSLQHRINEKNEVSDRDAMIANGKKITELETLINQLYPAYLKIKNASPTVSVADLRSRLASLDATLIEYFWGEGSVYAFAIFPDSTQRPEVFKLASSELIGKAIDDMMDIYNLKANKYSPEAVLQYASTSNSLYKWLLEPMKRKFSGSKRIIIVPDGPIGQIPFETLVVEGIKLGEPNTQLASYNRLHYLLNDHIVSYAFSGSYLMASGKKSKRNPSVLAFGFTGTADVRSPQAIQPDIAGTETELLAIQKKFPQGILLYGADVTEKKFKDVAAGFDLLHLAVHGSGDTEADYSAALYFRDTDGQEDGRLYWYELYGMNLQASLAVLSSCESGIGKSYRGEGMLSMANAFTFAGCSNIVMGLWKVDDQVSVKLMNTFYSELIEGMAIDEALAMAKRTYLLSADQVSANPKLWGSLVAYGETPILTADKIHAGWVVVALTALIGAIILLVVKTRKK